MPNRIITFGKVAQRLFPSSQALPHTVNAGEAFYAVGIMAGIILWGSAFIWFAVAVVMLSVSGPFPFNMGWWGFIFPIGEQSLVFSLPNEHGHIQSDNLPS